MNHEAVAKILFQCNSPLSNKYVFHYTLYSCFTQTHFNIADKVPKFILSWQESCRLSDIHNASKRRNFQTFTRVKVEMQSFKSILNALFITPVRWLTYCSNNSMYCTSFFIL